MYYYPSDAAKIPDTNNPGIPFKCPWMFMTYNGNSSSEENIS